MRRALGALAVASALGIVLIWMTAAVFDDTLLQREREQHDAATRVLLRRVRRKFAAQEKRIRTLASKMKTTTKPTASPPSLA